MRYALISSRILLSEFPHLRTQFWGRHLWACGYLAVSSGNIIDEMIQTYIEEQEGEPGSDDSRFQIHLITPNSADWDEDFLSNSDADGPFPNPWDANAQGLEAGMTIAFVPEKTTEVGY